uniref:protein yellow-like n=1 Tax=Vespula vulgaris TaxID=7454 RepID=UPI002131200F|nr:protein yellow-like [Vespula vulgaris]XP_050845757.1 protein yellow-like [Vespula vulgaris]
MIRWIFCFVAVLSCSVICNCELNNKMKIIYSWKALEFAFPSDRARATAIKQGTFIPGAPVPIDVDFYYGERQGSIVFVTIPRFIKGIPATFGYVTDDVTPEGNPIIAPYPSWEWNKEGDCNVITSVFRVAIDKCNRLWVLDTGKVGDRQICRPQLHVFSLINNRLIHQYKFPRDQFKDTSLFVTPVVDIRDTNDKCRNTFVYIADVTGFGLLVYDYRYNRSWKIENKLFYPYPSYGTFNINGDTFDLMDGIFALALGPIRSDGDRILYFHSLASKVESWVATSTIRNYSIFVHNSEATPRSFKPFALERQSQSAAEAMNEDGVLFFGLLSEISLACWNSKKYPEYGNKNIENILFDRENLQFPSGMKLKYSKKNREEIWILTSSFQRFMTGTLHSNETNFRILAGFVDELVRGTKCDSVTHAHGPVTFPT